MGVEAGWYDDSSGRMRWWNGEHWTDVLQENGTVLPTASEDEPRSRGHQTSWVVLHWLGSVLAAVFALLLVPAVATQPELAVASVAGVLAMTAGSLMATSLARDHLISHDFIRGTTTSRAVAGAWVLIIGGYAAVTIVGGFFISGSTLGATLGRTLDEGIFATFLGVGTLLAIMGPGYSEYSEAHAKRTVVAQLTAPRDA